MEYIVLDLEWNQGEEKREEHTSELQSLRWYAQISYAVFCL